MVDNMTQDKFTTEDEESLGNLITWLARMGEEFDSSKIFDIVKLIDKKMEW